jgi:deoxyadenosine/deoxycytidine kinase
MLPFSYIAVEGPIGVGKTTLSRKLAERLKLKLLPEDIKNPFLASFYAGKSEAVLRTQMCFLHSRALAQQEIRAWLREGKKAVTDFTFQKDLLFARINLSREDMALYRLYYDFFLQMALTPDLIIYLQAPERTLKERIRRRKTESEARGSLEDPEVKQVIRMEKTIKAAYLTRISEAYEKFFIELEGANVLIVNTEELNVVDRKKDFEDLLERILEFKPGIQFYSPQVRP